MNAWLAIFLGGGLGSVARYGVSKATIFYLKSAFPWGTLGANLLSCVVMGLALGLFSGKLDANPAWKAMLVIGFCGGFSTFSTFSFETLELMRNGQMGFAIANVGISIVACVGILWVLSRNEA